MKRGITSAERAALEVVKDKIAAQAFRHFLVTQVDSEIARRSSRPIFNMEFTCEETKCGTAACIGGFVALEMGMTTENASDYVKANDFAFSPLYRLYFPYEIEDWETIRPMDAYRAISNMLETGDPDWTAAVKVRNRE